MWWGAPSGWNELSTEIELVGWGGTCRWARWGLCSFIRHQGHAWSWTLWHSVCVLVTQSCLTLWSHGLQPTRLLCPWNSAGKNTGVGCHFSLQGIFLTQGSNTGLQYHRQFLYCLSHQGSPITQQEHIKESKIQPWDHLQFSQKDLAGGTLDPEKILFSLPFLLLSLWQIMPVYKVYWGHPSVSQVQH